MNPSEPLSAAQLLARNIRRLREERGLSIDDLACRTGIGAKRIAGTEAVSGQAHLEVDQLAIGLGIRIGALFAAE